MTSWKCIEQRRFLGQLVHRQLPSELLVVAEAHAHGCARCGDELQRWRSLQTLMQQPVVISDSHAETLLRSVQLAREERRAGIGSFGFAWVWAAAVMLLLVLGVGVVMREKKPAFVATPSAGVAATARGPATWDSRVTLRGDADVVWESARHGEARVSISRGHVEVDLMPLVQGESFEVCTAHTCARAVGTAFAVYAGEGGPDRVTVEHGVVAVSARALRSSEILLGAGDSFVAPWIEPSPQVSAPEEPLAKNERCPGPLSDEAIITDPMAAEPCLGEGTAEQWMLVADAYLRLGESKRARVAYERVLRRFPKSSQAESAVFLLAQEEWKQGHLSEVKRLLALYSQRFSTGLFAEPSLWLSANVAVREAKFAEAATLLETLLHRYPRGGNASDALYLLGSIYERELGEPQRAVPLYERYLASPAAEPKRSDEARRRLEGLRRR